MIAEPRDRVCSSQAPLSTRPKLVRAILERSHSRSGSCGFTRLLLPGVGWGCVVHRIRGHQQDVQERPCWEPPKLGFFLRNPPFTRHFNVLTRYSSVKGPTAAVRCVHRVCVWGEERRSSDVACAAAGGCPGEGVATKHGVPNSWERVDLRVFYWAR